LSIRAAAALIVACSFAARLAAPQDDAWDTPPADKARRSPLTASADNVTAGRELYRTHCLRCHGEKGRGDGPGAAKLSTEPADLSDPVYQSLLTDGEIFWKITTGRRKGKEVLMPAMAPEKIPVDEDRWRVVAYVRSLAAKRK
jgi:mono/diheme cytochrome c family protein